MTAVASWLRGARPGRGFVASLVLALLAALGVALVQAPAVLADRALDYATQGHLRLADVRGTLWSGSGRLVLVDKAAAPPVGKAPDNAPARLTGVALPGTVRWQMSPWPLLVGMLDARLEHDAMQRPVFVTARRNEWRVSAGALVLPAVELDRLGSPWNTIRPSAVLSLNWESLTGTASGFEGRAAIELSQTASALTPVAPLGSYRIEIQGASGRAMLRLATLAGPLQLSGEGSWDARGGLRFLAEASADPAEQLRLSPLLALIGQRQGDRTLIRIGAGV